MTLIGYARVSTEDQLTTRQFDELRAAAAPTAKANASIQRPEPAAGGRGFAVTGKSGQFVRSTRSHGALVKTRLRRTDRSLTFLR